jgi:transcriptional regulator with XRE-family HTH domain
MKTTLSQRLADVLHEMEINEAEFARVCGLERQLISRIHKGVNPSFETLQAILTANSKMNPRWFILGEAPAFFDEKMQAKMEKYMDCSRCKEKNLIIEDLRNFNEVLKESYEMMKDGYNRLKEECDKLRKPKKGRAA